ncbi:MAG: hypothetical protein AABX39_04940 [Nanoarchaeota archaeon]
MPEWKFINGLNNKEINSFDPMWLYALEAALESRATPLQSGYHVNTGAVTKRGNVVLGSNHEIAVTDTITHGEEAVIVAALEKYGKDDPIQIIAFAGLGGGTIGSPCGNCRDAIKQYTDLDNLVVINAPRDGGVAVVVQGKVFFKDTYEEIKGKEKAQILYSQARYQALKAEKSSYDIYLVESSPKIYGAAVVCENGAVFRGSFRGNVAYHPDLPISAAISNFRDGSDDPTRRNVSSIVVAATETVPDVMYKDRQDSLEFAEAIQALNSKSGIPLQIYLVHANEQKVFKTDTNEWLPFSFSPKNL